MTCQIIIPIKPPETAKMRLAGVLPPSERAALVRAMLHHVVATAQGVATLALLGPSRYGLAADIPLMRDTGGGLNGVLAKALRGISADRIVVLAADLPLLTREDLVKLLEVSNETVVIATDRHSTGTNALSLPLPKAREFAFAYGADSLALHQAEAVRLGLHPEVIFTPGLAKDIDSASDLPDSRHLWQQTAY